MKKIIFCITFIFLLFSVVFMALKPVNISAASIFNWPMNVSKSLSASFGEIRGYYLHQGIDVKTNGRTGYPVFAAAPGRISRIISGGETGYGNAVFIDHNNGIESASGHLESFDDGKYRINTLVKTMKIIYNEEFVDVKFSSNAFKYNKDEKIAYSGEAGSVPPHLHFDIRENGDFANPLDYIHIKDTEAPVMENILICTDIDGTTINEKKINLTKKRGNYTVKDPLKIEGSRIFFKISCFDKLGAENHVSVYRIRLTENNQKKFELSFDNIKREALQYAPYVYDISRSTINGQVSYTYVLCRKKDNQFSGISAIDDGYIYTDSETGTEKKIDISVSDFAGNETNLNFRIIHKKSNIDTPGPEFTTIDHSKKNDISDKDKKISLTIPKGALSYNSLIRINTDIDGKKIDELCRTYSISRSAIQNIFSVYPYDTVYKKNIEINFKKPEDLTEEKIKQVLIYHFFDGMRPKEIKTVYNKWKNEFHAESIAGGFYALILDKTAPVFSLPPTFEFCRDIDTQRLIRINVSDDLSGINTDSIFFMIDGEKYPVKYNRSRKWIEASLAKIEIAKGMHHLFIKASDKSSNESVFRNLFSFE